jgi:hypothetical protein
MTGTLMLKSMLKDREQAMADFTRWTATINLDFRQSGGAGSHSLMEHSNFALFHRYPIAAELRLALRGPAQLVFLRTTIASLVLAHQRLHFVPEAPDNAVARYA